MSKHTPGPWFVFGNGHCVGGPFVPDPKHDPQQETAGVAMCGMRLRTNQEAEANARLIAAAPDLLEILKDYRSRHGCGCGHPHCNECERDKQADAIIAKATGN